MFYTKSQILESFCDSLLSSTNQSFESFQHRWPHDIQMNGTQQNNIQDIDVQYNSMKTGTE